MKLTILTPLFPPDIAPAAMYTKELASRLACKNKISLLHYGSLPERVNDVQFYSISKQSSLLVRMTKMTLLLFKHARTADIILVQNGPSVELPALLASLFYKNKLVLLCSDKPAHKRTQSSVAYRYIHWLLSKNCLKTIEEIDTAELTKPFIHPFRPHPSEEIERYEKNWHAHILLYQNLKKFIT